MEEGLRGSEKATQQCITHITLSFSASKSSGRRSAAERCIVELLETLLGGKVI